MEALTAEDVYEQTVKLLPIREQMRLVEQITRNLSAPTAEREPQRRHWREIRGLVAYPYVGEDAQQWVSRTRREADEARERQWGRNP